MQRSTQHACWDLRPACHIESAGARCTGRPVCSAAHAPTPDSHMRERCRTATGAEGLCCECHVTDSSCHAPPLQLYAQASPASCLHLAAALPAAGDALVKDEAMAKHAASAIQHGHFLLEQHGKQQQTGRQALHMLACHAATWATTAGHCTCTIGFQEPVCLESPGALGPTTPACAVVVDNTAPDCMRPDVGWKVGRFTRAAAPGCYPVPDTQLRTISQDTVLPAAAAGLAAAPAGPVWQVKLASDVLARLAGEYALDAQHRTKRKAYTGELLKVSLC